MIPNEYRYASRHFDQFIGLVVEISGLSTPNQAYTMVQGVFQTFRRRLSLEQAIAFAGVLLFVLSALFIADWDTAEPRAAFGDRADMTLEVQALRKHHNFSPDTAIGDVAAALRRCADQVKLDRVLARSPSGAVAFWRV